jgi:hypothetical protein
LLDNFSATIHWENLSALREEFPRVRINDQLFTIDRDRFTCSGGTAPLDLMLNLIQVKLGPRISQLVSEQFIVERVRKDTDRQYIPLRAQVGVSHRGLIRVAQLMEENIEKPLSLENRPNHGAVAPPNRTPLQARSELRAEALLQMRRGARRAARKPPCPSWTSRRPADSSRRRIFRIATACNSGIRRARSARSAGSVPRTATSAMCRPSLPKHPRGGYSEFVSLPKR